MQELKRILSENHHKSETKLHSEECPVCDFELLREGCCVKIPSFNLDAWLCPKCNSIFDIEDNTLIKPMTNAQEGKA